MLFYFSVQLCFISAPSNFRSESLTLKAIHLDFRFLGHIDEVDFPFYKFTRNSILFLCSIMPCHRSLIFLYKFVEFEGDSSRFHFLGQLGHLDEVDEVDEVDKVDRFTVGGCCPPHPPHHVADCLGGGLYGVACLGGDLIL